MSGIYARVSELLVTGAFNWTAGSWKVTLVGPGYTPNYLTDTTIANVPPASVLLPAPVALTGLSTSNGAVMAANVSWPALTTSAAIEGVLILDASNNLVAYIDQGDGLGRIAAGLPAYLVFDTRGIFRP